MDEQTLNSLLLIVRLGLVSIFLWLASRLYDLWSEQRKRRAAREAYIRAIFAEVDFNTYDMSRFLDSTIAPEQLLPMFEKKADFVPHITDARHTEVYRSRIDELDALAGRRGERESLVGILVQFYGELEKVTQQIEGLSKPSFKSISPEGKMGTIERIYQTCLVCETLGKEILWKMERAHPELRLRTIAQERQTTKSTRIPSAEEAKERLNKLQSDLDRINAKWHG